MSELWELREACGEIRQAATYWLTQGEDFPRVCEMAGLDCAFSLVS
jgi:hypothetical protein